MQKQTKKLLSTLKLFGAPSVATTFVVIDSGKEYFPKDQPFCCAKSFGKHHLPYSSKCCTKVLRFRFYYNKEIFDS